MEALKDHVRDKIRASTPKNRGKSRARVDRSTKIIRRALKKLTAVLEFTDQDTAMAVEVLRDQMLNSPMPKIAQDAALAILAWKWGRPTERKIVANIDAEDFPAMLERMRHSPVAQEKLGDSLQEALGGKQSVPVSPPSS